MSSFVLKVLACIFMLIDHIGYVLFPGVTIYRILGRIAFPIFAWQISVGYKNTSNVKKYIFRLGLFALISQIPYSFVINPSTLNVFFTLTLGVLSIFIFQKSKNKVSGFTAAFLIMIMAEALKADYGAYGAAMIFLFYLSFENKFFMAITQILLTGTYSYFSMRFLQLYSLMALVPISFYNGKRGARAKYLFYIFYPVHLFALYIIKLLM